MVTDFGEECYNESTKEFAPEGSAFVNPYEVALANYLMSGNEDQLAPLDELMSSELGMKEAIFELLWVVAVSFLNGDGSVAAALSNRMSIAGQAIIMAFEKTDYLSQREQHGQEYYFTHSDMTAEKIARGHAYQKHVIERGEFPEIKSPSEFEALIVDVMKNPESIRVLPRDRVAYWKGDVLVIVDPNRLDWGTAFRPTPGRRYFDELH